MVETLAISAYRLLMSTADHITEAWARLESDEARQTRIAWEAEMIAEARAQAAAGMIVSEEQVDAWIDSLGTDHELPPPSPLR